MVWYGMVWMAQRLHITCTSDFIRSVVDALMLPSFYCIQQSALFPFYLAICIICSGWILNLLQWLLNGASEIEWRRVKWKNEEKTGAKKQRRVRIIHIEMKIHGKYRDLTLVCNILKIVASVIISSMVKMPGSFDTKLCCAPTRRRTIYNGICLYVHRMVFIVFNAYQKTCQRVI